MPPSAAAPTACLFVSVSFGLPPWFEDEARYRTIGLVHDVLTVVYCDRENADTGNIDIRIISARLATKLERNAYNNNIIGRF